MSLVVATLLALDLSLAVAQGQAAGVQLGLPAAKRDRYLVKVASAPEGQEAQAPRSGRLLVFFLPNQKRWSASDPADAPFFEKLQPVAAIDVRDIGAGATFELDSLSASVFGGPLDELEGGWRVQAVLDTDFTERGHLGPGNLVSEVQEIDLARDRADEVEIALVRTIKPATPPAADPDGKPDCKIEWIERRSAVLSRHFGREFRMRAGVVLPYGYHDLGFPRRMWPTVYVIGGFGGNHLAALDAAAALQAPEARAAVPQAVWVFLDPETAWGHHGFCDSEANGPVGRALVEEFVPFLEERFRLIAKPEARLVTGHSSGGWTALHLAVEYPAVFGACFASAPDPVDFSAFQRTDLYRDASLFLDATGADTPSFRAPLSASEDRVLMTVRDEVATETVLDPNGRSGQQWSAWNAMWSPLDASRRPRPLCDPVTGAIDPVVVEAWSRHDLARRFARDPEGMATLFASRIRLLCGSRDSFYLNEAVARLKARIGEWRARTEAAGRTAPVGPGYIEIVPDLTHDTLFPFAQMRFHQEMSRHLREHGLAETPPRPAADRPDKP